MDEQSCPRCKTTSYRNPNLKLLVNVCGHKLCHLCVDVIFSRPSAACPQCGTALRRSDFRVQQFEDASVEREVDIRRKIVKIFNKREEDFVSCDDPLAAYNDYLESIEIIIFNLANNVDVEETKRKIERYKKENEAMIRKNNSKLSQEQAYLQAQFDNEKLELAEREQQLLREEEEEIRKRRKDKESLINDLIYANAPADEVIARHKHIKRQQEEDEQQKKSLFFKGRNSKDKPQAVDMKLLEAPMYVYKPIVVETFGPEVPTETVLLQKGYLAHVRAASAAEKAAGYTELMACHRALQEAFDSLFL